MWVLLCCMYAIFLPLGLGFLEEDVEGCALVIVQKEVFDILIRLVAPGFFHFLETSLPFDGSYELMYVVTCIVNQLFNDCSFHF